MQLTRRPLGDATPGVTDSGFDWSTFIPQLLTGASAVYTQQQLLDYNKQLIAAGQQPLSASAMQAMMQGAMPGVNIGVSADVKQMLTYGLVGAAGLATLYIFMRRAR